MKKKVTRYILGSFASLFLVFALSASQPSPVCAAVGGGCDSGNTVLKCGDGHCCTVTKDDSEICDCEEL